MPSLDPFQQVQQIQRHAPPGFTGPGPFWFELVSGYGSPGRHYHTLEHINEMAEQFHVVSKGPGWRAAREVFLAVLAHDVVYDVSRTDNEAVSAQWGARWAKSLGLDAARVVSLVEATATHGLDAGGGRKDLDLPLFLDCDLSILGASPERFAAYEQGVAQEYAALYSEPLYRAGRQRFLEGMFSRETLFHTEFFRERLEDRARGNLMRALLLMKRSAAPK